MTRLNGVRLMPSATRIRRVVSVGMPLAGLMWAGGCGDTLDDGSTDTVCESTNVEDPTVSIAAPVSGASLETTLIASGTVETPDGRAIRRVTLTASTDASQVSVDAAAIDDAFNLRQWTASIDADRTLALARGATGCAIELTATAEHGCGDPIRSEPVRVVVSEIDGERCFDCAGTAAPTATANPVGRAGELRADVVVTGVVLNPDNTPINGVRVGPVSATSGDGFATWTATLPEATVFSLADADCQVDVPVFVDHACDDENPSAPGQVAFEWVGSGSYACGNSTEENDAGEDGG